MTTIPNNSAATLITSADIVTSGQSKNGDQPGVAVYWVRVDPRDATKNQYELALTSTGGGLFFHDVDAAWAHIKASPIQRDGWSLTAQVVCLVR